MIDLEAIKKHRALWEPDDCTSLPTICEHVDTLVAEVERLRLDRDDIEHAYSFARDKAKFLERQAVVAWLLARAERVWHGDGERALVVEARNIERGEHLPEDT